MTEHGYTIAEIAAALGVSKQAIHKKRKSEPLTVRFTSPKMVFPL